MASEISVVALHAGASMFSLKPFVRRAGPPRPALPGDDAGVLVCAVDCSEIMHTRRFLHACRTVVAYRLTTLPLYAPAVVSQTDKLANYDSVDDEVLRSYNEFALANLLYFALKEGAASEQSARMTAMDGASKNAGTLTVRFRSCTTHSPAHRPPALSTVSR